MRSDDGQRLTQQEQPLGKDEGEAGVGDCR